MCLKRIIAIRDDYKEGTNLNYNNLDEIIYIYLQNVCNKCIILMQSPMYYYVLIKKLLLILLNILINHDTAPPPPALTHIRTHITVNDPDLPVVEHGFSKVILMYRTTSYRSS